VLQSLSVWLWTERTSPLRTRRTPRRASAVVKAIERAGQRAIAIQADAIDADAIAAAVEKTVATFGRLDVLVNKCRHGHSRKRSWRPTLEEMDRVLDINVRGVFAATQAALKHRVEGGRIIMIGSAVGERAVCSWACALRGHGREPSRCSLRRFPESWGAGASRSTNVQPGPIDTDLNPASGDWACRRKAATALDRYGRVDEIAAMVAFVAGPEASYITGRILPWMAE